MTDRGVAARVLASQQASDDVLAQAAPADDQAFSELYRRHVGSVYRFMRYQASAEEAQDLTSQVFFHAFRASEQFRSEAAYRTWLFRIAHNTVVSWRRGRARLPVPVADLPDVPDGEPDASHRAEEAETGRVLWEVVRTLPVSERELVALRYVEGLKPREIAEVTGIAPGAVRVRLHRLLRRLRRCLEERGICP